MFQAPDVLARWCWTGNCPERDSAFGDVQKTSACWFILPTRRSTIFPTILFVLFSLVHLFQHGHIYIYLEIMKYCISLSAHCLNFWAPFLGCLRRGSIFFHVLLWPQSYAYLNYIHCDEASFSRLDQSLDLFRSVLKWFGIRSNVDPGCC